MDFENAGGLVTAKGLVSQPEEALNLQDGQAATQDGSLMKRPRDVHTIHLVLNQYGVNAYQERVPLQLMDFAYRYTSGILQDALHFVNESYPGLSTSATTSTAGAKISPDAASTINLSALRLAIRSRTHYQYNPNLSKEFYTDLMNEKNKIALPPVQADSNLQLPPEQYMLTGLHWDVGETFDMMDAGPLDVEDTMMQSVNLGDAADVDEEIEGGTMEDLFGRSGTREGDDSMEH